MTSPDATPADRLADEIEFRPIPGFSRYSASACGKVRGVRVLDMRARTTNGYLKVTVVDDGGVQRTVGAHKLVALAWLGRPAFERACVGHLDGCKTNNNVSNLAWVSYRENERHKRLHGTAVFGDIHPNSILSSEQVVLARKLNTDGVSIPKLARLCGVSRRTMFDAVKGGAWKCV